ncbi:MAG: ATP-binding protein [Mobilitalea sp.]
MTQHDFIQALSHGKDCIWLFNIHAERLWHPQSFLLENNLFDLTKGMESVCMFLTKTTDYLITTGFPNELFEQFERHGFEIPNLLTVEYEVGAVTVSECVLKDKKLLKKLEQLKDTAILVPFAITDVEEEISRITGIKLVGASAEIARTVNDKVFSRQIADKLSFPVCEGGAFDTVKDAYSYYLNSACKSKSEKMILKSPYSASGKGMYIIENEKQFDRIVKRADKLGLDGCCILEKWQEAKTDLNYQILIEDEGIINMFSLKQQLMSSVKYVGSVFLIQSNDWQNDFFKYGQAVGSVLYQLGYRGVANIDAIKTTTVIIPILEINGRFSLSTYTSFCFERLNFDMIITKYYDVYTSAPDKLKQKLIEFTFENERRCIVYSFSYMIKSKEVFICRAFVLFFGSTNEQLEKNIENLENILKTL